MPTASAERIPVRAAATGSDQSAQAMSGRGKLLAPVERFHALPKPCARKGEIAFIRSVHQRRYYPAVFGRRFVRVGGRIVARWAFFRVRQRRDAITRGCFCRDAKLQCGLGQPAQRLVENTRVGALEIRRTLHGLDVEISLGELGPFGSNTLAVGIGVEQDGCEAVGAAGQSAHELDQLWRELAHQDQTTDKRRTDDTKRNLRAARHQQRIGSARLEGGRDGDDCDRVACELEAIGRKITHRTRGKVTQTHPHGDRGHEQLTVLGQPKYQRDRNQHPGDGAKDAIEALGENESAVRLRYHEDGQKRPAWIVEASPECDVEREQRCRKRLDREGHCDRRVMVEPIRLLEEPVAQRQTCDSGLHQ